MTGAELAVRRPWRMVLAALLLAVAAWQGGAGLWHHGKAWLAQALLSRAWAQARAASAQDAGRAVRPWPWADTWPVARLTVPRLGVDHIVLSGVSGQAMAFGPAHVGASAAPGDDGNCVIGGHRDTHFAFLRAIEPGDSLRLERLDGRATLYVVRDAVILDAARGAAPGLRLKPDGRWLTLVTCWPFDAIVAGGPGRYLIMAEAVDDQPAS